MTTTHHPIQSNGFTAICVVSEDSPDLTPLKEAVAAENGIRLPCAAFDKWFGAAAHRARVEGKPGDGDYIRHCFSEIMDFLYE